MAVDFAAVPRSYFSWKRRCSQFLAIAFTWVMGQLWFKLIIIGREKLPHRDARYVMVANHNSNWDPPILAYLMRYRPLAFMAKQELFTQGLTRGIYRALGTFAVNRHKLEKKTIKTALMVMRETDWTLSLFPEGTRHFDPDTLGVIKTGAVSLAKMGGLPILPIGLNKIGRGYAVVIGDMIPVPQDVNATNEVLKATLLDLKLQAKKHILG